MKIINNLNKSTIISKIKYPFIKIASLFERITVSHRIRIVENPKYLSAENTLRPSKDSNPKTTRQLLADITDHINTTNENDYQDIDEYNSGIPLKFDATVQHLYTRINKTGNGKIDRYLPSEQKVTAEQNTKVITPKNGQAHPFLKEMVPPPVPPKSSLLIAELAKKNPSFMSLIAKEKEIYTRPPLSILKGFELFI